MRLAARQVDDGPEAPRVIDVLVVDDSVVMRRLITDALSVDPAIRVVGTASNGRIALARIEQFKPDVVTLDIEMPVLDGLGTLREIRKLHRRLPVIMFSTLTALGANATLEALASGASDYVTKPANVGSVMESLEAVRRQLVPRIHALAGRATSRSLAAPAPAAAPARAPRPTRTGRVDVLAIGSSTGGPAALQDVLTGLPASFPVPIVVVQHMPPMFTQLLAERLDRASRLTVVEAENGVPLQAGTVYIAPGTHHLEVARGPGGAPVTRLTEDPPENSCRPAVDVLFRSVGRVYAQAALGVVLTGMGHDGRLGAEAIRTAGGEVIAQDEASSVVWGMPGSVVNAGLAAKVLPLDQIGQWVVARVTEGRSAPKGVLTR